MAVLLMEVSNDKELLLQPPCNHITVGQATRKRQAGYDLIFTETPPEDLICQICHLVAKEPQQVGCCGKVCCKTCITGPHNSSKTVCPNCKAPTHCFPDMRSDRQIKLLKISCRNESSGCRWTGTLQEWEKGHNDQCAFALMQCPNLCGMFIPHCKLEDHTKSECPFRLYMCCQCKATGLYLEMISTHEQQCPNAKISCPNGCCSNVLLRCHLESHRAVCPNEVMDCNYSRVGCKAKLLRKDVQEHENECAMEHARLALRGYRLEELEKMKLKMVLTELQTRIAPATFRMTNFKEHRSTGKPWVSFPFFTHQGGYRMHLSVNTNGCNEDASDYLSVYVYMMVGQYDSWLQWPFRGSLTIQLLNQVSDEEHRAVVVEFKGAPRKACERVLSGYKSDCGYGRKKFILLEDLAYNVDKGTNYLKEDCLYFKVSVRPEKPWLSCTQ